MLRWRLSFRTPGAPRASRSHRRWLCSHGSLAGGRPTASHRLERELQGKSAGIRTQTIVGTAAALILLVSKYGFSDVLVPGTVEVDPSRVAAQIVSGIGFLGAGIIIFRRGSVHGLTTAAAIWESAAIGMAAGEAFSCSHAR